jgi:hypothetical protein
LLGGCSMGSARKPAVSEAENKGGPGSKPAYLMTYFRSGPNQTDMTRKLHYAFSRDGLHWYELNGNEAVWSSPVGGQIIRDPFMSKDKDGTYHLVHTMQSTDPKHKGQQIGYASTKDLISFTDARALTVMGNVPGTVNCWAPEWNWDQAKGAYMVHWSSTQNSGKADNNRIYKAYTKDWKTFTPAEKLFDPGYSIIDSNIVQHNGKSYMYFKDEANRPMRNRLAISDSLGGGYGNISKQLTPNVTEGAEILEMIGENKWYMYYDYWADGKYGIMESTDLVNWSQELPRENMRFPYQRRHASFFPISEEELFRLFDHYSLIAAYPELAANGSAGAAAIVDMKKDRAFADDGVSLRSVVMKVTPNKRSGTQLLYDEGGAEAGIAIRLTDGKLQASAANGAKRTVVSAELPENGSGTDIAVVFADGNLKLYVDGELKQAADSGFVKIKSHKDSVVIGGRVQADAFGDTGDGAPFSGKLSRVAVYNIPLQPADVQSLRLGRE